MDVQILTLCDFAEDFSGKLCVTGTFDTLRVGDWARNLSSFCIAVRLAFDQGETGRQDFAIGIKNDEGGDHVPELKGHLDIGVRKSFMGASNLVLNLNGVSFRKAGIYFVNLSINGIHRKSISFAVEGPATEG